MHHASTTAIERMGMRDFGVQQLETVAVEPGGGEERRDRCQRMDRRAHVVREAGERELRCPRASSDGARPFEDEDRTPCLSTGDRSGKSVRPRSHDHGVRHVQKPRRTL